jgi:MFS family permease
LLALGVQAGGFSLVMWLPTYLKGVRHISTVDVGYNMFVFTAGSFFGYIGAAYLCDTIGRRRNFLLFVILNWIFIPIFLYLPSGTGLMFVLDFTLGFASLGIFSALGPYFTELFPTSIRANGQGFAYNFGRGLGAFFPTFVGVLSSENILPLRESISVMAIGSYVFVLLAIALLPETKGRDLNDIPDTVEDFKSGKSFPSVERIKNTVGPLSGGNTGS